MSGEPTVKSVLIDARARIENIDDWTQRIYRRVIVDPKTRDEHCAYCATGAIIFSPTVWNGEPYNTSTVGTEALMLLQRASRALYGKSILEINDERAGIYTGSEVHERVLRAYDVAIEDAPE